MASDLVLGKYELSKSDKLDEFLIEMGVDAVRRMLACSTKPVITITKDGDVYTMKTSTPVKTSEISFQLGEEFNDETQKGDKVRSTITADGNKLVHSQKAEKYVEIVREFTADGFNAVAKIGDVTCTQFYKRL